MSIGLYQQYGSDGLYFYFWEQSFGRITGENEWENEAGPFFLLQNFLWQFLPWTFVFLPALWMKVRHLFLNNFKINSGEAISLGGFILPLIALSLSSYQLPHYIYVVLPMAAMMSGGYLINILKKEKRSLSIHQGIQLAIALLILVLNAALLYVFPEIRWRWIPVLIAALLWIFFVYRKGNKTQRLLFPSLIAVGAFFLYFNGGFYQKLLQYQGSSVLGKYYDKHHEEGEGLYFYKTAGHALDFYGNTISKGIESAEQLDSLEARKELWVYTNDDGFKEIKAQNIPIDKIKEMDHYSVQFLSFPFLNPETRHEKLSKRYLLYLK
jgi:4-amino-4-deoxy-L-arabinose transferase-like glycosyltransferase